MIDKAPTKCIVDFQIAQWIATNFQTTSIYNYKV
jgi:hypothetical protein